MSSASWSPRSGTVSARRRGRTPEATGRFGAEINHPLGLKMGWTWGLPCFDEHRIRQVEPNQAIVSDDAQTFALGLCNE